MSENGNGRGVDAYMKDIRSGLASLVAAMLALVVVAPAGVLVIVLWSLPYVLWSLPYVVAAILAGLALRGLEII